jgi:two-component system, NarL family, response regulator NreC
MSSAAPVQDLPRVRTRVLIADDHAVVRAGLKLLIGSQPDLEVVADVGSGEEALAAIRATKPDVALLDLSMPSGGIDTIARAASENRRTRVFALTMHDDPAYVRATREAGAAGYVVKLAGDAELLAAIRAARSHSDFLDVGRGRGSDPADAPSSGAPLSPRLQEVLRLLARGHTNREIAEHLGVGVKTVETYRRRLVERAGLRRRSDYVRYALLTGILSTAEVTPGPLD